MTDDQIDYIIQWCLTLAVAGLVTMLIVMVIMTIMGAY